MRHQKIDVLQSHTTDYMKVVTLRIPQDVLEKVEEIAKREDREKSEVMREIIKIGLKDKLLENAVKMYAEGKVSMWKAAKMADVSLWEFIEILKKKGIELQYGIRELEEDIL